MRLLLIGGTEFVGRHILEQAVAAGHEVTVFHRGVTESSDLPDVEHLHGDRDGGLGVLEDGRWDAAVDVCGYSPRIVRLSADVLAKAVDRYCFISSESVYADPLPPVVTEDARLATMAAADGEWGWYGPLKVLCERVVDVIFGERGLVVRPGYVVGPHDRTDRFTSWVRRSSLGGTMLAPGGGEDTFQFVDARDLGGFVVGAVERSASGAFNADGEPMALSAFLATAVRVAGAETRVTWIPEDRVRDRHLEDLFPMWEGGDSGSVVMDASRARSAGLANRPIDQTIADTLAWDRERGLPQLEAGMSPEREAQLLDELG
ncbi:MAG TPA: NAD-dependent epimerase/dehydratase family protein [Actinomycetota bacterium]|nr:NAD-dependent epimerase/dehydratase family protein [Actinomycetota bacterium]